MGKELLHIDKLLFVRDENFTLYVPSLTLERGLSYAVIGPSGCGKSTLLECIGLMQDAMHVEKFILGDKDLTQPSVAVKNYVARCKLGFMPQVNGLIPFLSIDENIKAQIALSIVDKSKTERKLQFNELYSNALNLCQKLGIENLLHKKAHEISIGQKQRAVFVRACAHNPELLLIDEPTSALDPTRAHELFSLIKELCATLKITSLVVTHDSENVSKLNYIIYSHISMNQENVSSFELKL